MMALMLFASVALAVTIQGNGKANDITGTPMSDKISAKGGDDTVDATQGGKDDIMGARGDDDIDTSGDEDETTGNRDDFIDCGKGMDTATTSPNDRTEDCETAGTAPL